jgi:hypothetical protein
MKKIKVILPSLFFFLLLCGYLFLSSPFNKIQHYNEDYGISPFTYLELYKTVFPKKKFDKLIDSLITGNMDIPSIDITAEFCKEKRLYEYIPLLERKCNLFATFPKDSTWVVKITEDYSRESGISELGLSNSVCKNLNELKRLQISESTTVN